MTWQKFAATNAPGTCKWCGRALRQKYFTKYERVDGENQPSECYGCHGTKFEIVDHSPPWKCLSCATHSHGSSKRKVVKREKTHERPGDYGDGHFCGLRCAYSFAVCLADHGSILNKK